MFVETGATEPTLVSHDTMTRRKVIDFNESTLRNEADLLLDLNRSSPALSSVSS